MVLLEIAAVVGAVGALIFVAFSVLMDQRSGPRRAAPADARWQTAHYAAKGVTRVVVRKVEVGSGTVLDEHIIAEILDDDADYDAAFLTAMASARERVALYESEEPG